MSNTRNTTSNAPAKQPYQDEPELLGKLWLKSGNTGEYFSGFVKVEKLQELIDSAVNGEASIVVFPYKTQRDKAPTHKILKSTRGGSAPAPAPATKPNTRPASNVKPNTRPAPRPAAPVAQEDPDDSQVM